MAIQRTQTVNRNPTWSTNKRYKVNDTVFYSGKVYQNVTGFNSTPGVGLDWILLLNTSSSGVSDEDVWTYFKGDLFMCQSTGAGLSNIGYSANPNFTGSGTNQPANLAADYSTQPQQTWYHRRLESAATAGSNASATWQQRISSVGLGFYVSAKTNCTKSTNARFFYGLTDSISDIGNVNPSTLTNMVGFGIDSGDANLQFMHNDGSGTATKVDLGIDFAITSTNNPYVIEIINFKGSSTVKFRVKNLLTNVVSDLLEVATDLPTITTGLAMHLWANNGVDAVSVPLHFSNHTYKRQS